MTDRIVLNSSLIEPIYSQPSPNEPISLGQLTVQIAYKGATYEDVANISMVFVPNKRIEIVCPLKNAPLLGHEIISDADSDLSITLKDRGIGFEVFCASVGGDSGGTVFLAKKSGFEVTSASNSISTVTFHLFNFPDFLGPEDYILTTTDSVNRTSKRCDRIVLQSGDWRVTIAATDQTDKLTKAFKTRGGYALTHMGQITRVDESTYSSEQLTELLNCLHYFLSFALGRWAGVALPVGFDAAGNRVFEEWGMRITADGAWHGGSSWFDSHHSELLSQIFPGFVTLWMSKLWRKPLMDALYWYLGACDRRVGIGVDTGLILAQTALELLAWNYCVVDRKMISPSAFQPRRLSAADKFRLLASSLNIPLEIPANLTALHARRGSKWMDSMDAITDIRNSLVHPATQHKLLPSSYFEAWKLSLWYIELVLLRLSGHTGMYANRLSQRWSGIVDRVPWAQKRVL
jgi:hypothetical protein